MREETVVTRWTRGGRPRRCDSSGGRRSLPPPTAGCTWRRAPRRPLHPCRYNTAQRRARARGAGSSSSTPCAPPRSCCVQTAHLPHQRVHTTHSTQHAPHQRVHTTQHAARTSPEGTHNTQHSTQHAPHQRVHTTQHAAARSSTQQHAAARSSTQQHAAARSSTQQHAAARSSTQQHAAARSSTKPLWLVCDHIQLITTASLLELRYLSSITLSILYTA